MDDEGRVALDTFIQLGSLEESRLEFTLDPGEAIMVNNRTVLYARGKYDDHTDEERKQLLLRIWLVCRDWRPMFPWMRDMRASEDLGREGYQYAKKSFP